MSVFVCMYVCAPCVYSSHGDQKGIRFPEIKVTVVVRHTIGTGNWTWKSNHLSSFQKMNILKTFVHCVGVANVHHKE